MNRKWIILSAAVIVVAAVCAFLGSTLAARGGGDPPWDYAVLDVVYNGNQLTIELSTGDQFIAAQDWATFYKRIGASPAPAGRAPEAVALNGLGSNGWQLVTVYRLDVTPRAMRFIFTKPGP